jgi:hypothetical protein
LPSLADVDRRGALVLQAPCRAHGQRFATDRSRPFPNVSRVMHFIRAAGRLARLPGALRGG